MSVQSEVTDKKADSRIRKCLTPGAATESGVAVAGFGQLLDLLAEVPDPRRAQGKLYSLPHVLLFSILAIVTGCNSSRGIVTFIDVHRHKLNEAFGLRWRRAPAHTAIRYILQRLDPAAVEATFRRHAALLQVAHATSGQGCIALDGKTLRGSFDNFRDRAAPSLVRCNLLGGGQYLAEAARKAVSLIPPFGQRTRTRDMAPFFRAPLLMPDGIQGRGRPLIPRTRWSDAESCCVHLLSWYEK